MKVRGERECQDCGTRWSYYETGSVECPECGSLRSVGVEDERRLHTAKQADLDLTPARQAADESLRRSTEEAAELAREFTRGYGFVKGGDLQPLDDTYLAAMELRHVADLVGREMRPDDEEEYYLLVLLRGAEEGKRPAPEEVPEALRSARGLGYADAVAEYRDDLRDYLDEHPDPPAREVLETLGEHVKRVQALQGDVSPEDAERLVVVARDVGTYLRKDDEQSLVEARERLDALRE